MRKIKIDATILKFMAVFFMLLDHMWATIIPGNQWMNFVGRLAFPIFAFQIVEGFVHTSNFRLYARRLFIFGLISEIPFNLFYSSSIFYPFHQNVMFTLLLGLLAIRVIEKAKTEKSIKAITLAVLAVIGAWTLGMITFVDYQGMGVLTVVAFYVFRDFKFAWLGQLVSMILLNIVFFMGLYIPIEIFGLTLDFQTQGFAVLALIPIWLYNGKKGSSNKIIQYGMYAFYPVHIFVLYLIAKFI